MVGQNRAAEILGIAGYSQRKIDKFLDAHQACPEVWQGFEYVTLSLIAAGRKAGAIDVLGRVRWESSVEGGLDWKVNNNYAPYYARIFTAKHPEHAEFFEFRGVRDEQI